jgi:arylsulfatase A
VLRDAAFDGPLHEAIVVHSSEGFFAIRQGQWKLLLAPGSGGVSDPRPGAPVEKDLPPVQLYDLDADPKETRNLQATHQDVVRRLTTLLEEYQRSGRSR